MKKIILKENESVSNEIITNAKAAISNGKKLISMLDKLGLTLDEVTDWQAVEEQFTKDYPKATLIFNLQANGIEEPYREAEAFYLKHRHALRFEPLTEAEIEAIKEEHRVYADQPNQIEALELFETIKDSFIRLAEIGVKLDLNQLYDISKVYRYDPRQKPAVKIDPTALYHNLINLK